MTNYTAFDEAGLQTCQRLGQAFNMKTLGSDFVPSPCKYSLGLEIEVPWSSYFPSLWESHGLKDRRIGELSPAELMRLTQECTAQEFRLLPQLHKTIECGIPRGNDRYWEFAFKPVHDERLVVEQVRLLSAAGALPRDKSHSLQITIGGEVKVEVAALYRLAMMLEVLFVDPERINNGIGQTRKTIHTGWARKGMAGLHLKSSDELQGGCESAYEIRTLQLPQLDDDFSSMMKIVRWGLDGISEKRLSPDSFKAARWLQATDFCKKLLLEQGLSDKNWFKSADEQRHEIRYSEWNSFSKALPEMKKTMRPFMAALMAAQQLDAVQHTDKLQFKKQRARQTF